jgi:predicted membrane channel-forming protein YqfA (hemolysin III family)
VCWSDCAGGLDVASGKAIERAARPWSRCDGLGSLVAGGLIYSVGAAVYALRRPDPVPAVFGAAHCLAISRYTLSTG